MASKVGQLNVVLTATTAPFSKGLAGARNALAGFGSTLTGTTGKLIGLGSAAIAAVGGAGLAVLVKQSFASIDATAKLADQLGLTTQELTGLQHGANLSGVSSEQLATALRRMEQTVSDAGRGTKTAVDSLAMLGLTTEQLIGLRPAEQLGLIADSMGNLSNQSDRAAVAQQLFGRSGIGMLSVLQGGSAGLAQMSDEAARLGLTFSREQAAGVEQANDAMTRLTGLLTGATNAIAIQLAPYVTWATSKLVEMGSSGEGMGSKIVKAFEWVTLAIAKGADWVSLLSVSFNTLRSLASGALAGIVNGLVLLLDGFNKIAGTKFAKLMFGEIAIDTVGIKMFADELKRASTEAGAAADKGFGDFMAGANEQKVKTFFQEIKDQSAAASAQIAAASAAAIPQPGEGVSDLATASKKTSEFRQISASRTAIGGASRAASKTPVQADPMELSLLQQILNALRQGPVATAG